MVLLNRQIYASKGLIAKSFKVIVKLCCSPVATKLIATSQAVATAKVTKLRAKG